MSKNYEERFQSKKIGILKLLKIFLSKLSCCEIMICLVLSLLITIFILELISPCVLIVSRELWIEFSGISASIASFILTILVLIYGVGGKLNTDYHKNVFPELTSVISLGVLSHLVSVVFSLVMYVIGGLTENNICMCRFKFVTLLALFVFVFSMINTFNIVFHTYSIHSFFNSSNK